MIPEQICYISAEENNTKTLLFTIQNFLYPDKTVSAQLDISDLLFLKKHWLKIIIFGKKLILVSREAPS